MENPQDSRQNLLIVGGTASISNDIIQLGLEREFKITATFRTKSKCVDSNVDWVQLDISDQASIESFNEYIKNKEFRLILFVIGELSLSESNKEKYLITNLMSATLILESLRNSLDKEEKSVLLYVASRSAIYPSFDLYYSIVKAGLAAAVRSLSLGLLQNQKMLSIAPGLIVGSSMYEKTPKNVRKSHHTRSDYKLLDLKNLASEVFKIIDCQDNFENGSLIEVGPKYK
jgi:hypothetical protein